MDFNTATKTIKVLKLIVNVAIFVIFTFGASGSVMGIQGPWRYDVKKTAFEMLAGFTICGFLIRDLMMAVFVVYRSIIKDRKWVSLDVFMNLMGLVLYIVLGILALQYWRAHRTDESFTANRRQGIALGVLCSVEAVVYLADSVLETWYIVVESLKNKLEANNYGRPRGPL